MIRIYPSLSFMLISAGILLSCSSDKKDELKVLYFNPQNLVSSGSYYSFSGTIDQTVTSSCGKAEAPAGSTTSAISASSTPPKPRTKSLITSYYVFELGKSAYTFNYPLGQATMFLKYEYNTGKDSFSLSPLTTNTRFCPTLDFIKCNGTSGVSPECETADGLTCGGTHAFSFVSTNKSTGVPGSEFLSPDLVFQGKSGIIKWEKGFSLNANQDTVIRNYLEISMTSSDGKVFRAEIYCNIPSN